MTPADMRRQRLARRGGAAVRSPVDALFGQESGKNGLGAGGGNPPTPAGDGA